MGVCFYVGVFGLCEGVTVCTVFQRLSNQFA